MRFATLDELRMIVKDQKYELVSKFEERLIRFKKICRHENSKFIKDLYGVSRIEDIVKKDYHPLEDVLINFRSYKLADVIETYQIKILENSETDDLNKYVLERLTDYYQVFSINDIEIDLAPWCSHEQRNVIFNFFTDLKIIDYVGCYVPFNTRPELIRKLSLGFQETMFFILTKFTWAKNKQTTYLSDVEDLDFAIGYGKVRDYQVYELDELLGSFTRDDEVVFYKPDSKEVFTNKEIEELDKIIRVYNQNHALLKIIKDGLIVSKDKIAYDSLAKQQLVWVPSLDMARICLREIFKIGMYMRRWLGPGHPYPLLRVHTKVDYDPEPLVWEMIKGLIKMFEQMDELTREFIENLRTCEFNEVGVLIQLSDNFGMILKRVDSSAMCIRIASSIFVGTGYHYLRVLFREVIEGIEGRKIDRIG
jgi:hypothetical protein